MPLYFLLLSEALFQQGLRPALAESWRRRSFEPSRTLCAELLPAAQTFAGRFHITQDEILHLSAQMPFDVGFLHYASDTPYSRRQSLLSKSLSYFGVDSTYACAIATGSS